MDVRHPGKDDLFVCWGGVFAVLDERLSRAFGCLREYWKAEIVRFADRWRVAKVSYSEVDLNA